MPCADGANIWERESDDRRTQHVKRTNGVNAWSLTEGAQGQRCELNRADGLRSVAAPAGPRPVNRYRTTFCCAGRYPSTKSTLHFSLAGKSSMSVFLAIAAQTPTNRPKHPWRFNLTLTLTLFPDLRVRVFGRGSFTEATTVHRRERSWHPVRAFIFGSVVGTASCWPIFGVLECWCACATCVGCNFTPRRERGGNKAKEDSIKVSRIHTSRIESTRFYF